MPVEDWLGLDLAELAARCDAIRARGLPDDVRDAILNSMARYPLLDQYSCRWLKWVSGNQLKHKNCPTCGTWVVDTICPFATYMPISANTGPAMQVIRGFAPHSQVGYHSLYTTFNNPSRKASTHFWVSQTGAIEQYVPLNIQAWAQGPGNPYFWSAEHEGLSSDSFTDAQIDASGYLIAWLSTQAPFPLVINRQANNGHGISPHRDFMQTDCPGNLRLSQYDALIAAAEGNDVTPEQMAQIQSWIGDTQTLIREVDTEQKQYHADTQNQINNEVESRLIKIEQKLGIT